MDRVAAPGGLVVLVALLVVASFVAIPRPAAAQDGIDYIVIVDGPNGTGSWVDARDYLFGDSDVFWAAGYNNTTGWVADVSAYWMGWYDPGGTSGGVIRTNTSLGPSVRVDTNGYGVTTLTATYHDRNGNASKSLANTTGPLHVSVENVDSVVILSDRGGTGTWVGPTTYSVGDWDLFYAAASNDTEGFLGDITANWTSSNATVGKVWPSTGSGQCDGTTGEFCYPHAMFSALAVGFTYVTAEPVGTALSNTTGKLTVTTIEIDYVQIRDAPNGGGTVMGSRTYYTGEQDTFYAASYNATLGYLGDVVGDWTSNDTAVCEVRGYVGGKAHGSSVQVLLNSPGVCAVTVTATTPSGVRTNTTGPLTVLPRTILTVDDSGGADFYRIQDAVDFAQDGYTIFIHPGTYAENVVVTKELELVGAKRESVVLDGQGGDIALYIGADRVLVHEMTIANATHGIFQDRTNNTRVYDSIIRDYGTGLYNNRTLNGWVAYNLITRGEIGVLTMESYDDAIRWNEISYNTKYGAKSFNTRLRNCFNWNHLHHNRIAYFHDPDTEYDPMEFDGNLIEDNEIGVKVENASSIRMTNNAFVRGTEGVQLLNSSAAVDSNTFASLAVAVRCFNSGSNVTNNAIAATDVGIACDGGSPRIEGNDISVASGDAIVLANVDGAILRGNDVHGGTVRVSNSRLTVLGPVDANVLLDNTAVSRFELDASSVVEMRWTVRVAALDGLGQPLPAASVVVRDARGVSVFEGVTGPDGLTPAIVLTTDVLRAGSIDARNPFTFEVSAPGLRGSRTMAITGVRDVAVTLLAPPPEPGTPTPPDSGVLLAVVAVAFAASASLGAVFAVERSRYALLALFVPLYTRLSRDKVLESYNRGRVYEYVELNPGRHFNAIRAALGMNNGSLVYHLEVLQRAGLVRSRQEGMYRRFYPHDADLPPVLENGVTEAQHRVLRAIEEMPGITQKELARFLGLRQSTLAYQTDRLATLGLIEGEKRGRAVHYTVKRRGP